MVWKTRHRAPVLLQSITSSEVGTEQLSPLTKGRAHPGQAGVPHTGNSGFSFLEVTCQGGLHCFTGGAYADADEHSGHARFHPEVTQSHGEYSHPLCGGSGLHPQAA